MELSVSAPTTFQSSQDKARYEGVRANLSQPDRNTTSDERRIRAEAAPASPEAQKARDEAARKKDPAAEAARNPGFTFEYEGKREVMKVHDGKGVLIYQVPSKGQLTLVQDEEFSMRRDGPALRLIA